MSTTVKTVTEIEYDDKGRVVKETKTVTETPTTPASDGHLGTWVHPPYGGHIRYTGLATGTLVNPKSADA